MKKIALLWIVNVILGLLLPVTVLAAEDGKVLPQNPVALEKNIYATALMLLKDVKDDEAKSEEISNILADCAGYSKAGKLDQVRDVCNLAFEVARTIENVQVRMGAMLNIAKFGVEIQGFDVRSIAVEMSADLQNTTDPFLQLYLANVYALCGVSEEAASILDQQYKSASREPEKITNAMILNVIREVYITLDQDEKALKIALLFPKGEARDQQIYLTFSSIIDDKGQLDKAIKLTGLVEGKGSLDRIWHLMAEAYARKGDLTNALKMSKKIKAAHSKANTLGSLGSSYPLEFDLQQILNLSKTLTYPDNFHFLLSFVQPSYDNGHQAEAQQFFKQALDIALQKKALQDSRIYLSLIQAGAYIGEQQGSREIIQNISPTWYQFFPTNISDYWQVCDDLWKNKQYELMATFLDLLTSWAEKVSSRSKRMEIFERIAVSYLDCKRADKAQQIFDSMIELAARSEDTEVLLRAYLSAADAMDLAEQFALAREYRNKAYDIFNNLQGKYEVDMMLSVCIWAGDLEKFHEIIKSIPKYDAGRKAEDLAKLAEECANGGQRELALQIANSELLESRLAEEVGGPIPGKLAQLYLKLDQPAKVIEVLQLVDDSAKADIINSLWVDVPEGQEAQIREFSLDLIKYIKDSKSLDKALANLSYDTVLAGDYVQGLEILLKTDDHLEQSIVLRNLANEYAEKDLPVDEVIAQYLQQMLHKAVKQQ